MRRPQVSLLVGNYALKVFDFAKSKDAEQGWSGKVTAQIKEGKFLVSCDDVERKNIRRKPELNLCLFTPLLNQLSPCSSVPCLLPCILHGIPV